MTRGPRKRSLLFLHVPKTGGSTLTGVLSNRFAAGDQLPLYFGPEPDLHDIDRFRYVSGHLTFSFLEKFQSPPFVVTFLRDPVDRALSSYSYTQSFPPDYQPPVLLYGRGPAAFERYRRYRRLARECSIDELIDRAPELARAYLGNRQASVLCGKPEGGDERLDDALEALERCDFIGLTERLDESAAWLVRRLGWRDLGPLPRANTSRARLTREQLSPQTLDALLELTSIDRELYRHGRSLYERRIAEWGSESDHRDHSAQIPDAPVVSDLRFDEAIQGGCWLGRERVGDQPWFCWVGSPLSAWADLAPPSGADSIVVEIAHAVEPEILERLRIKVNGEVVSHRLAESDGAVVASAQVRRRRIRRRGRPMRVQLQLDRAARPCDVDPASPDNRELAIAVRRIALVASERA